MCGGRPHGAEATPTARRTRRAASTNGDAEELGDRLVRHLPGDGVDAEGHRRIAPRGAGRAVHGDLLDVRQRGVRQRVRARVGHGAGHVADGVVDDAVQLVHRIVVRRLVDRLDAAALVDGDVDDHGVRLHPLDHLLADDDRRPAAGDEHGADDEVGVGHAALDGAPVGRQRHDPPAVDLVDPAQPVEVLVDQHDLGLHAGGDPRRVPPDVAGAEHDDLGRPHAGRAAHQHAAPAVVALEEVGALLRRQPAGDLAHRRQQRQRARSRAAPSRRRARSCRRRRAPWRPPGRRRGGGT